MKSKPQKTRKRRSIEERLAEKESEVEELKSRMKLRELRAADGVKQLVAAVRAIDRGAADARARGDDALQDALDAGREPLATYLAEEGITIRSRRGSAA